MRIGILLVFFCITFSVDGLAQSWAPPSAEQRCPSRWGATDERGAANHMNAARVLQAAKLIRTGEIIELGRILDGNMPLFGTRRFEVHTKRTGPVLGANKRRSNEEIVITELGQVGTQFDMFSHQTIGNSLYNCIDSDDIGTRSGFSKLGIEKIGMLFTRGVLLDVAALKGVDMLEPSYEITPEDLDAAAKREGVSVMPGDAVLIHTGWGRLWGVDNARYNASCPGLGVKAAEWLAAKDVMLLGADNFPVEIAPNPDKLISLPVHQIALVVHGIFLLENMKLDQLASSQIFEFAFAVQPLKIRGGTGSTVAPVAIR